ncbi:hypothetical protein QWI29_24230 [Mycolicibacterium neoaurum]|uniref:hypothetical protein n=1 Tax=Mycolicibacterium neoaurum TaxID=1795 RepID=UPI0026719B5D|nr:hypothetical protein [Mycolicibacterium neoaurum]MDO3403163.1 hypothetical protein [Mycolicibacterium neoaurum]
MRLRVRPYLMAGVAVVAAGSISLPSSVTQSSVPTVRHDSVALTAQARTFDALPAALVAVRPGAPEAGPTELPKLLAEALDTAPSAQASALALPGLGNAIIDAYYTVMPWVDWGVNLAVYATEWIPLVNLLTPQIDIFYYSLIRPIITSGVFNFAYWVGGTIDFSQGLTNFFNESVAAAGNFVNTEINWFLSLFPPLPPFFPLAAASQAVMAVEGARTAVQIPATPESTPESSDEQQSAPDESAASTPTPDPTSPDPTTPEQTPAPQAPVQTTPQPDITPETSEGVDEEGFTEQAGEQQEEDLRDTLRDELREELREQAAPESDDLGADDIGDTAGTGTDTGGVVETAGDDSPKTTDTTAPADRAAGNTASDAGGSDS